VVTGKHREQRLTKVDKWGGITVTERGRLVHFRPKAMSPDAYRLDFLKRFEPGTRINIAITWYPKQRLLELVRGKNERDPEWVGRMTALPDAR
jgi:hypothetical protein